MNLVSCLIDDFLFISFSQKNEIKKGKYPTRIHIFTFLRADEWFISCKGWIDFKRNLTDGNLIWKCVAVFIVRGILLGKGFWVINTWQVPERKCLKR